MDYLLASKSHMIDLKTWEFVQIFEPVRAYVPFYIWDWFPQRFNAKLESHLTKTFTMPLNKLTVTLSEWKPNAEYCDGRQYASMEFYDAVRECQTEIDIEVAPSFGYTIPESAMETRLKTVEYNISMPNHNMKSYHPFEKPVGKPPFQSVRGLGVVNARLPAREKLSYGIHHKKWPIEYRGQELSFQCYVLLCGTWGIMLTDKFKFDSLALLDSVNKDLIRVRQFVYTVNPTVIKCRTLLG